MQSLQGNTWPIRTSLRDLGGQWDPHTRRWDIPDDHIEEARAILAHFQRTLTVLPPSVQRITGSPTAAKACAMDAAAHDRQLITPYVRYMTLHAHLFRTCGMQAWPDGRYLITSPRWMSLDALMRYHHAAQIIAQIRYAAEVTESTCQP
jgi:hypothetical protein